MPGQPADICGQVTKKIYVELWGKKGLKLFWHHIISAFYLPKMFQKFSGGQI